MNEGKANVQATGLEIEVSGGTGDVSAFEVGVDVDVVAIMAFGASVTKEGVLVFCDSRGATVAAFNVDAWQFFRKVCLNCLGEHDDEPSEVADSEKS